MQILVTGANGQLGSEIRFLSSDFNHSFIFCDIEEMDLSNQESISGFLKSNNPELIVSCGAYTAVDKAQDEPALANQINAEAPKIIAQYCKSTNVRLIYISTDYIFDGDFKNPISENDIPCPQSVYGDTKLKGENNILSILDSAYIIRTSWVYSTFGNNFVNTMLRLGAERSELNVVSDQIGTPTYAQDLASVILILIDNIKNGNDQPGIYHYSNEGVCSWYDFAKEIFRLKGINCKVNPIPTSEYPTRAKRPAYSVLKKEKIKSTFKIAPPYWGDSLRECLAII